MAETIHAANRGENITIIFINNAVYGMTQGQMAPTTLIGQKTTTTPRGRDAETTGYPIKMCELLNQLQAPTLLARSTLTSPKHVRETRKLLKKAFEYQLEGAGFSLLEVLSPCPTYWHMTPMESFRYIDEEMTKVFPLGIVRDTRAGIPTGRVAGGEPPDPELACPERTEGVEGPGPEYVEGSQS